MSIKVVTDKKGKVYKIKKFKMKSIDKASRIVFLGSSGSGKTWMIKELMYKHREIPEGICMAGTKAARNSYKKFIPDSFIYKHYEKDVVKNFIKNQESKIKHKMKDPTGFFIMDDLLYEKSKWVKSTEISYIFMNSRNDRVFYILSLQYPIGIGPDLRTNIDYTFIARETIKNTQKKIYENYASVFEDFPTFKSVLEQLTEDYTFLVIDNNVKSNRIEDQIFWYKAKERNDFKVGSNKYWDFHYKLYNNDYEDRFSDG